MSYGRYTVPFVIRFTTLMFLVVFVPETEEIPVSDVV